ncbi:MAG: DUF4830 domain-containing protein [Ruminococcus sp.]|nr:DUF4830 domain-containing protein [Ruminococcus sp.]
MIFCLVCAALFCAACFFALRSGGGDTVTVRGESYPLRVDDETDVVRFLEACGYEAPEPVFQHEITVPKNWNETYTKYNELQRQQGFDLVPYKGKAAEEFVYFISEARNVTVLTSGGKVIAAHLCDVDGGEMRAVF